MSDASRPSVPVADVPGIPRDACEVCGSTELQPLKCKVICRNCRTILRSCADL